MGEYSNSPGKGAIDRKAAGDMGRGEYRYFNPTNPQYAREDYKQMERIRRDGNSYGTIGEWRRDTDSEWEEVDSVWGHLGYKDPSSPYENVYVIDHMRACIDAYRSATVAALGTPTV